ncbi:methyltransferase domain-containing protein [Zooshikella sp. RANM57]|uniref:methyltransferase domain-containing protein n=1 Tax=Zooshikella sp. RANM57 TaxID=3425863 RepID=UPI003D6FBBA5
MSGWSPDCYLQFANERLKPIQDLIHRISYERPKRVVDLGCGPGNSTAELRNRWPYAEIMGIDQSSEMLNKARQSGLQANWLKADISHWQALDSVDVLFANAVLHWLPNHEVLFPRLIDQLTTSGILAVQMPANFDTPLYQLVDELVSSAYWHKRFKSFEKAITFEKTAFYYDVLAPLCSSIDLWETCYCHVMENHQAILNWFRGTGLRPYLTALDNNDWQQEFEQQILMGYQQAYPKQENGYILFPFRRLFIVAQR